MGLDMFGGPQPLAPPRTSDGRTHARTNTQRAKCVVLDVVVVVGDLLLGVDRVGRLDGLWWWGATTVCDGGRGLC